LTSKLKRTEYEHCATVDAIIAMMLPMISCKIKVSPHTVWWWWQRRWWWEWWRWLLLCHVFML